MSRQGVLAPAEASRGNLGNSSRLAARHVCGLGGRKAGRKPDVLTTHAASFNQAALEASGGLLQAASSYMKGCMDSANAMVSGRGLLGQGAELESVSSPRAQRALAQRARRLLLLLPSANRAAASTFAKPSITLSIHIAKPTHRPRPRRSAASGPAAASRRCPRASAARSSAPRSSAACSMPASAPERCACTCVLCVCIGVCYTDPGVSI